MKIIYCVSREQLEASREQIFTVVREYAPDAYIEVDPAAGRLTLELPDTVAPDAAEALRLRLLTVGVVATRVSAGEHANNSSYHYAQPPTPPIDKKRVKPRRTVPLVACIALLVAVSILVSIFAFTFGALVARSFVRDNTLGMGEQQSEDYVGKISLIDSLFEKYSLYDTDGQLLLDEMLKAYAAATGDKYAAYYTEEEFAALMDEMGGESVGIGVSVTKDTETGEILVIQVFPGSPAERAGVRAGDRVTMIGTLAENEKVSELGYDVAMNKMLGDEGTTARFVVRRDSELIEFAIVRATFISVSVNSRVSTTDPRVGIVSITRFDAHTPAQFKEAMSALIEAGCDRFVYDVRNNPGGEQKSVMTMLSYFAKENDVTMSVVNKDGATTYYHAEAVKYQGDFAACSLTTEEIGMYRDYPAVVLTGGYTASAAELFTAGLVDYGVATVVGMNTYGKGVIQTVYNLAPYGYSGGIKLTTGYYAPPSGVNYDGVGILPTLVVEPNDNVKHKNLYLLSEEEDNQLIAAIGAVLSK